MRVRVLQSLTVLEDMPVLIPGVSFSDADYPKSRQRYRVTITAQHGNVMLERYDLLQVFNITRDGYVNGTEQDFDSLIIASNVREPNFSPTLTLAPECHPCPVCGSSSPVCSLCLHICLMFYVEC